MLKTQTKINTFYKLMPKLLYDSLMEFTDDENLRQRFFMDLHDEDVKKYNETRDTKYLFSQRILDVACGTGLNFKHLSKNNFNIGFDLNSAMLSAAKEKRTFDGMNVPLTRGDATKLPFKDNTFQKAIITYGLSAIPENYSVLSEMERVVSNDGLVGVLDFSNCTHSPWGGQQGGKIRDIIDNSNLEILKYKSGSHVGKAYHAEYYILKVDRNNDPKYIGNMQVN